MLFRSKAAGTIAKYLRDIRAFVHWLAGRAVNKEMTLAWRETLLAQNYAPVTINAMLSALNRFFDFMGWQECRVKFLRIQRRLFRESTKELRKDEYQRLLAVAGQTGRERLALLMETICATGIRVSEVPYITIEAVRNGQAEIVLKGKIRVILLPNKLCRKLQKYAKKQKIVFGEIFITKNGNSLSRKQIWSEMKTLCVQAQVESSKVFPHNLRHLFATSFYNLSKDIAKLADVLGHSSIETTRIYLRTTSKEHLQHLEFLGLIS